MNAGECDEAGVWRSSFFSLHFLFLRKMGLQGGQMGGMYIRAHKSHSLSVYQSTEN